MVDEVRHEQSVAQVETRALRIKLTIALAQAFDQILEIDGLRQADVIRHPFPYPGGKRMIGEGADRFARQTMTDLMRRVVGQRARWRHRSGCAQDAIAVDVGFTDE